MNAWVSLPTPDPLEEPPSYGRNPAGGTPGGTKPAAGTETGSCVKDHGGEFGWQCRVSDGVKIWVPHDAGRDRLSALFRNATVEVANDLQHLPSDPADVHFWVPTFRGQPPLHLLAHRMTGLRVLQLPDSGTDDWTEVVPPGVALCSARGVHDTAAAEWVMAAILAGCRLFPVFAQAQRERQWATAEASSALDLRGARVLMVGAGSIGQAVAGRLRSVQADVILVARTPRPHQGVYGVHELSGLLSSADIVVILVPLTTETDGMVDSNFLAAMKDGALLVNAAPGPVVNTMHLRRALSHGRISAVLEVPDPHPLPAYDPLWHLPNVFVSPHLGAITARTMDRVYQFVCQQVARYVAGRPLVNQVTGLDPA